MTMKFDDEDVTPDDEVLASLEQYKDFLESSVWEDFEGVLSRRAALYQLAFKSCSLVELSELQAGLKELEFFIAFPKRMVEVLSKQKQKQDEGENNEREFQG